MIFDLVRDFAGALAALPPAHPRRRMLALLEEAIRRDVQFLDRHPTTLFQCLWNSCWWYDCPPAAGHYEELEAREHQPPPWLRSGELLFQTLERWRERKERTVRVAWVRSLRPPTVHLGAGNRAVLRGHQVYDKKDREVKRAFARGCVAHSPDGLHIVSSFVDQSVRLWDVRSGQELLCLRGHESCVNGVAFAPDGRMVASGGDDCCVRLWDVSTGAQRRILRADGAIGSVAFSLDGARIVGADGPRVRIWDAQTGEVIHTLRGHVLTVRSVAFAADGRRFATGGDDGVVNVWDAITGKRVPCIRIDKAEITGVAFIAGGERIVFGLSHHGVRIWDLTTREELRCLQPPFGRRSQCIAVSPDGRRMAGGLTNGTIVIWDLDSGEPVAVLRGHLASVLGVAYSGDGRSIASISSDGTVRTWETSPSEEFRALREPGSTISSVAFSRDGRWIASGSRTTVDIWDADSGELRRCFSCSPSGAEFYDSVMSVAFSDDGRRLAAGAGNQTVWLWEMDTGRELHCLKGHEWAGTQPWGIFDDWENSVCCVALTPDGNLIASGSGDMTVRIWDANAGHQLRCLNGHQSSVSSVRFSPDGDCVVSTDSGTLRRWDVESGECLEVLTGPGVENADLSGEFESVFRAVARGRETVIESAEDSVAAGYYPDALSPITTHPAGGCWGGAVEEQLRLLKFEAGDLES